MSWLNSTYSELDVVQEHLNRARDCLSTVFSPQYMVQRHPTAACWQLVKVGGAYEKEIWWGSKERMIEYALVIGASFGVKER